MEQSSPLEDTAWANDHSTVEADEVSSASGGLEIMTNDLDDEDDERDSDDGDNESGQPTPSLHLASIASLCFGMLTHSYLLISVFPYSGYMAIRFIESANKDNAGSYAGMLASSFNFGRIVTAFGWGTVADIYGRKAVLVLSFSLLCILSVLFGLSPSFGMALLLRFSTGMANGIVGTNKTLVSDLAQGNEQLEAQTMSLVLGMWAWGFFVSPFVSGQLAEPVKQYPDLDLWKTNQFWASFLERFPFLLPNILGAIMCIIGLLLCHFFIQEPLPDDKRRNPALMFPDAMNHARGLWSRCRGSSRYRFLKSHQSDIECLDGTVTGATSLKSHLDRPSEMESFASSGGDSKQQQQTSLLSFMSRPRTRSCLLVYWGNSFVTLAIDEIFPLFCISTSAGFGLSERTIGQILSASGIIFAVSQYFIQSFIYNRYGLYGSIRIGALLSAPMIFLVPVSLLLNHQHSAGTASDDEHAISRPTFVYLCLVLALSKVFLLVFFSNISVAINRAVPSESRAALNGLSIVGGSVAKALGPSFAGVTATVSVGLLRQYGSLLMFGSVGLVSSLVAIASFVFMKENDHEPVASDDMSIELTVAKPFEVDTESVEK